MTYACRVHTMENNMKGRFINKVRGLYGKVFAFIRTDRTTKERDLCEKTEGKYFPSNVRWKTSNNNTSWNINLAFLESCLSISEANECLTGVNVKRNQRAQK